MRLLSVFAAAAMIALVVGCGSSTSVSGQVTYEGRPVASGFVAFVPLDGRGPTAGGPIKKGRYELHDVVPGKKVARVNGFNDSSEPPPETSAEMERRASTDIKKANADGLFDFTDQIAPNAKGNETVVEIKTGDQTINLELSAPEKK
jgi:hypothetical protein